LDLRVTKDPIHVYVIESGGSLSNGSTWSFIFDGLCRWLACPCDFEINWAGESILKEGASGEHCFDESRTIVTKWRSQRLSVPGTMIPTIFLVFGHGKKGRSPPYRIDVVLGRAGIRWRPTKPCTTGERLNSLATGDLTSRLVKQCMISIVAQAGGVRHGHAQAVFEENEKFQNDVSILAYAIR